MYFAISDLERWCDEVPGYEEYKKQREIYHADQAKVLGITIEEYYQEAAKQAEEFCEKLEKLNDSANFPIS